MKCDLPRDTVVEGECSPRCPWCNADAGEAKVSIEALAWAWDDRSLLRVGRAPDGSTEGCALIADCPACAKPFAIALKDRAQGRFVRCLAVTTKADRRLMRGEG